MGPRSRQLRQYVVKNLRYFEPSSAGGPSIQLPEFDVYPRDYLRYAEQALQAGDEGSLINCISHLKRAMDCQINCFLHAFGLARLFRQKKLSFPQRLDFLQAIGVFSAGAVTRLNQLRNRVEHDYEAPELQGLSLYLDIASAFVLVLERTMLLAERTGWEYSVEAPDPSDSGLFTVKYHLPGRDMTVRPRTDEDGQPLGCEIVPEELETNDPRITFRLPKGETHVGLVAQPLEREDFAYFFRVFLLLCQRGVFASDEYIIAQL